MVHLVENKGDATTERRVISYAKRKMVSSLHNFFRTESDLDGESVMRALWHATKALETDNGQERPSLAEASRQVKKEAAASQLGLLLRRAHPSVFWSVAREQFNLNV